MICSQSADAMKDELLRTMEHLMEDAGYHVVALMLASVLIGRKCWEPRITLARRLGYPTGRHSQPGSCGSAGGSAVIRALRNRNNSLAGRAPNRVPSQPEESSLYCRTACPWPKLGLWVWVPHLTGLLQRLSSTEESFGQADAHKKGQSAPWEMVRTAHVLYDRVS